MNIIIFGIGEIYRKYKSSISKADQLIAFLDNDKEKQEKIFDGVPVYAPQKIHVLNYEKVLIMSDYAVEIRRQLLDLGCEKSAIVHYREYLAQLSENIENKLCFKKSVCGKNCAIITNSIGYHGGALAIIYAAIELMDKGYKVLVVAAEGDDLFIQKYRKIGIEILIYSMLPYVKWDKLKWVMGFEKVIVNTYCMFLVAMEIAMYRKVTIWLHESADMYRYMEYWNELFIKNDNLEIYAVSEMARGNFIDYVGKLEVGIVPFGIPDMGKACWKQKNYISFAVIGYLAPVKQQLLFLEAASSMDRNKYAQSRFYIVGKPLDARYTKTVEDTAKGMENVYLTGELGREELNGLYENVDVVVVPSIEETMSMVAVETMMKGKVCIVSDHTGIAEYIQNGVNGFIFQNGNCDDLVRKMEWCVEHNHDLCRIGANAREVYHQYFTIQAMGMLLEKLK